MKDRDQPHTNQDALARWNRLPSEEGRAVLIRPAGRPLALRRTDTLWTVLTPEEAGPDAIAVDMPTSVLLPAFANAHTHLDLTHVGPRPHDPSNPRGFVSWIETIRASRATEPGAVRASVRQGVQKSLAGGVAAVGDIAGAMRTEPVDELRASPLAGVSYVEFFGTGARQQPAIDAMRALAHGGPIAADGVRLGLQPHALYSAGPEVFKAAAALHKSHGVALCTHLAESAEEWRLLTRGEGPMRDFLESMGIEWNEPPCETPTQRFMEFARGAPWLIAHANALTGDDLTLLLTLSRCVAFCPRGHAYFGHQRTLGAHRWRHLLRVGAHVCLATDSIINLPPAQSDRISPLDDARLVFHMEHTRDRELARLLVDMITRAPARAIGMNPSLFDLRPGPILGLVAVEVGDLRNRDPLVAALESDAAPELVALSDKREAAAQPRFWSEIYP